MYAQDPEGRKRRRIAPTVSTPVSSNVPAEPNNARIGHAFDATVPPDASDQWNYLAKWQGSDDSIVEFLDDEDEETLEDVSDASPDVIEEAGYESEGEDLPPGGPATRPSKLGTDRVTEIINDCIESYANAWKPGKGETKHKDEEKGEAEVPVVYDSIALWEEAHAAGQREELLEKYQIEAEYYRQRLDTLCEEISKDPGDTVAGVRMVSVEPGEDPNFSDLNDQKCRNLEITVELLERAEWFVSIYEIPPEADSGDESQEDDSAISARGPAPAVQSLNYSQRRNSVPEYIDLGSPSDSSESEEDDAPPSDMPTTPTENNKPMASTGTYLMTSDPVVAETIETPGSALTVATAGTVRSHVPLGDAPEHASIATVSRWSWSLLKDTQDRKRIVSKAIYGMSLTDKETMRKRLEKVGRMNMVRELPACVDMLLRSDKRMPGILPQDLPKIITFTKLFLCWWLCGDYFREEASKSDLEDLATCLRQSAPDPATFCDYVATVLGTTFSRAALSNPTQPSQAEIIEISDDDEPLPQTLPRWKRNIDKLGSSQKSTAIIVD